MKSLDILWAEATARGLRPSITTDLADDDYKTKSWIVQLGEIKGKDVDVRIAFQQALDGQAVAS